MRLPAQTRLLFALFALLLVFLVGTGGYYLLEDNVGLGAAAYMTIITLSTVGFSEQWNLSSVGKAWTVFIIVVGILIVALAFASLQSMIIGGEFRTVLGRRKLKDRIRKLRGHYIVCGYGRMGGQISRHLAAMKKKVVVVDCDEKRTADAEEANLDYVLGNAADEGVLCEAGITQAAGLVTVLHSDADNVFVTLTARGMCKDLTIIARAEHVESESKIMRAGANRVICPQGIGANQIVTLLARPAIARLVDITMGGADWEIEEVRIGSGSRMAGRSLRELDLRNKANVSIVAINTVGGKAVINPRPDQVLNEGDVIVVIGPVGMADSLTAYGVEG